MFYDLVRKNSKKSRKENTIFFVSLIVSIIAFYIILSLENQDVMVFLKETESNAVSRLLSLIPALYGFSLFILFFLVYFAGKYQLERRSHELGMYLMMGMRRRRLFFMLLAEEAYNSIISLIIGIPIAVFISEMVSMITARFVGLGIIEHKFSFSIWAVLGTIIGYFIIRLVAALILSRKIVRQEINTLILQSQEKKHRVYNRFFVLIKLLLGVILLITAYGLSISGDSWRTLKDMILTVFLGTCGTFLLFQGIGILFELILRNRKEKNGLAIFTFRQLQENVFGKSNSLAISSLLVLIALCCFGYGISVTFNTSSKNQHALDYTFTGEEKQIKEQLRRFNINGYIDEIFNVRIGFLSGEESFSANKLIEAIEREKFSEDKAVLLNNLSYFTDTHLISVSGYNKILKLSGKEPINLSNNQVALYNGLEFSYGNSVDILNKVLKKNVSVEINDKEYELVDKLYQDNVVTDRSINLFYSLIVPDELFNQLIKGESSSYWNATLKKSIVKDKGLMQAIRDVNKLLDKTDLEYESYIQNMGRQLFYAVAASYTTIYLAVIFLIIANTVIGVQFLMQQQNTTKRYKTIVRIGCDYKTLCKSARKQIKWYFGLPILVAAIGSIFGIRGLFTGITIPGIGIGGIKNPIVGLMIIALPTIIVLCMIEFSYMILVMKMSDKQIYGLMDIKREDN